MKWEVGEGKCYWAGESEVTALHQKRYRPDPEVGYKKSAFAQFFPGGSGLRGRVSKLKVYSRVNFWYWRGVGLWGEMGSQAGKIRRGTRDKKWGFFEATYSSGIRLLKDTPRTWKKARGEGG